MKFFMVIVSTLAVASAGQFGGASSNGGYSNGGSTAGGGYSESGGAGSSGGQTRRYVSVHIAPEEGIQQEARVIRVPGGDKHVNIIFVKTPSGSSSQQTEVILPEQPEQKNLVYVLIKKSEAADNIKIRRPSANAPTKPEVYFIKYSNNAAGGAAGSGAGSGFGGGSASSSAAGGYSSVGSSSGSSSAYGAPL